MALGEFALIRRHFTRCGVARADVALGVGDDAALLDCAGAAGVAVAASTATPRDGEPPAEFARRGVDDAVRALGAGGVRAAWLTLALSMDDPAEDWLDAFAEGLDAACARHGIALVGGDTTAGALAATYFVSGPSPEI